MIRIDGLSKAFGRRAAVLPLDLHVPAGSVFGLLGHNGAGKSTLLGMILGQVYPDTGTVLVQGHDVYAARHAALARVGAIFETPAFYDYLSGWMNLRCLCALTGRVDRRRMEEVVGLVGLADRIGEPVSRYSHGMRQRLALAQALLPDPSLLLLDEPTDGLDPEGIHEIRQLLLKLNGQAGMTIVFSSHLLHEAEQLCTHVAVMRQGRLLHTGRWPVPGASGGQVRLRVDRQDAALADLRAAGLLAPGPVADAVTLGEGRTVAQVAQLLVQRGFAIHELAPHARSLEDFYLDLVQEQIRTRGDAAA